MADLKDGETTEMQGSGKKPYILKNVGGVYSCSCPAWRNQSVKIDKRTCKHLRKLRGDEEENMRINNLMPAAIQGYPPIPVPAPIPTPAKAKEVPALLLAHSWDGVLDPTGWWMSEKLDGVRALWKDGKFITRQGNMYLAPPWFTEKLPNVPLDGELWIGRKQFQKTVGIVRRYDGGNMWKEVKFLVFDAPSLLDPFEYRQQMVHELLSSIHGGFAYAHHHIRVESMRHVEVELKRIESLGGEGLMLRKPGSLYEAGRSMTLLKVKSFFDDEAIVVDYQKGKGRHKGRVGSLVLKLKNGIMFEVGTGLSDADRDNPPPLGSEIKFKYQELTDGGVPRFPVFLGMSDKL